MTEDLLLRSPAHYSIKGSSVHLIFFLDEKGWLYGFLCNVLANIQWGIGTDKKNDVRRLWLLQDSTSGFDRQTFTEARKSKWDVFNVKLAKFRVL